MKNYDNYIKENFDSYKDYNKKIKYKVIDDIIIEDSKITSNFIDILNQKFTGYVIISPHYNEYILHVTRWENHVNKISGKNRIILYYNGYISENNPRNHSECDMSISIDSHIHKIELVYNRRISDIDPYGEEDDWDE